ncbi:hypothetical protein DFR86_04840 [Acidianus sulfidivorans JP7]|uniref:Uncharacterized protein n=1 Tax=Acidianus sulfidivorans JP7 TaxID=619593 RepID=A0A2U9ILR5_9CREN|nr:hypothetical protein [Acidianus sulfidivorans]AWR96953.1 hypothetical protein DFR86_04840 [Acidianus sulfidivorans JP7]
MLGQLAISLFALALIGISIIFLIYMIFYNDAYNSSRELEEYITLLDVKYHPNLLYYNGKFYLFFTVNTSVKVYLENITNVNGTLLIPINKEVKGFYWSINEIPEEAKTTLLFVNYGGSNNYITGLSSPEPININLLFSMNYVNNSTLYTNVLNKGNIPVYLHNITLDIVNNNNITNYSVYTIEICSWLLPNQSYHNLVYIRNATSVSAYLYYSDIIGSGTVYKYLNNSS